MNADTIIIGGGMVGAALAFGLRGHGLNTLLLDEGDVAFRAARGNFGLVWVQSKGFDCPEYAAWTRRSADLWPGFAAEMTALTGVDLHHERPGGLHLCLSEDELTKRQSQMTRLHNHSGGQFRFEMLDRGALDGMVTGLGPDVVGGSYSPLDGHANPLYLLRALQAGYQARGGRKALDARVIDIKWRRGVYRLKTTQGDMQAPKLVIAAGLGTKPLAAMLGLDAPIDPLRGQILVTERVQPFLNLPLTLVRQTGEGSVLMGDSHEDVGFDDGTRWDVLAGIVDRARRIFPFLEAARIVRSWGALRPYSPDGLPIYDRAPEGDGAFVASVHSGVTLAAIHTGALAEAIAEGRLPDEVSVLKAGRFHVH